MFFSRMKSLRHRTSALWCSSILILYEADDLQTSCNWGTCFSRKTFARFQSSLPLKIWPIYYSETSLIYPRNVKEEGRRVTFWLWLIQSVRIDCIWRPSKFSCHKNVGDTISQSCHKQRVRLTWRVPARGGKTFPVPKDLIWTAVHWTETLRQVFLTL